MPVLAETSGLDHANQNLCSFLSSLLLHISSAFRSDDEKGRGSQRIEMSDSAKREMDNVENETPFRVYEREHRMESWEGVPLQEVDDLSLKLPFQRSPYRECSVRAAYDLCRSYSSSSSVFHHSVLLLDRCLSKKRYWKQGHLSLTWVCFHIAHKMESQDHVVEWSLVDKVWGWKSLPQRQRKPDELIEMEAEVLRVLDWRVSDHGSLLHSFYSFLHHLLPPSSPLLSPSSPYGSPIENLTFLVNLCLFDSEVLCGYTKGEILLACLSFQHTLFPPLTEARQDADRAAKVLSSPPLSCLRYEELDSLLSSLYSECVEEDESGFTFLSEMRSTLVPHYPELMKGMLRMDSESTKTPPALTQPSAGTSDPNPSSSDLLSLRRTERKKRKTPGTSFRTTVMRKRSRNETGLLP